MKNKKILALTTALTLLVLSGCGNTSAQKTDFKTTTDATLSDTIKDALSDEAKTDNASTDSTEMSHAPSQSDMELFELIAGGYMFASGAGGWSTDLTINSDGTFEGMFHDSDMGDTGKNYENGTYYTCSFSGRFENVEKIDEFTYSMKCAGLNYEDSEFGKETIEGNMRFVTSSAYGMEGDGDFMVYLPGKAISELNEEFLSWMHLWYSEFTPTYLSFIAIHNLTEDYGFTGDIMENGYLELPEAKECTNSDLYLISGLYKESSSDNEFSISMYTDLTSGDEVGMLRKSNEDYATEFVITREPYGFALTPEYGEAYAMQVETVEANCVILNIYDSNCRYVTTLTQLYRFES